MSGNDEESVDNSRNEKKFVIHVEILQKKSSNLPNKSIVCSAANCLSSYKSFHEDKVIKDFHDSNLRNHIDSLFICGINDLLSTECSSTSIALADSHIQYHVFRLNTDGPIIEDLQTDNECGDQLPAAGHWILPSQEFHGLWDNLIFDTPIKYNLLNFASTTLLFSNSAVDHNVISWNRVILLHGPPGTGKTTLCKAFAQKLSIRLGHIYQHGQLLEINSHSLFSKWFSESGKLVMKMFEKIQEMIDNPKSLIFVLIDEVESLSHIRKSNGNEPSDSMRVVNALLTQIDQLKRYPNVLILATSNVTDSIDPAFLDRADIKHYVGLPSTPAIYQIYRSCVKELGRADIISDRHDLLDHSALKLAAKSDYDFTSGFDAVSIYTNSFKLWDIAGESIGLSARTLRKLPFLAHAFFLQKPQVTLQEFMMALKKVVHKQFQEKEQITTS